MNGADAGEIEKIDTCFDAVGKAPRVAIACSYPYCPAGEITSVYVFPQRIHDALDETTSIWSARVEGQRANHFEAPCSSGAESTEILRPITRWDARKPRPGFA